MSRSLVVEGQSIEVKQHAKLSPSGAKRWMSCPGSVRLAEEVGAKDKTNKYAAEGTVAHEVGELCLRNQKEPTYYLGQVIKADGFKFTVTRNMTDAVEAYVYYIEGRIGWGEYQGFRVELRVEVKCPLTILGIPGLDGGTSDALLLFWAFDNETGIEELVQIEVVDYKHGQGVAVEVKNNPQLMSYGLGALHELDIVDGIDDVFTVMTIVQPRAHHPDGRIRTYGMNSSTLFHWQDTELIPAALLTQKEDAPFNANEDACRFCKVAGQCAALEELTQRTAMIDFKDEAFPNPNVLTTEQKISVVKHADMLRAYIVAVENQVKLEVNEGSKEYQDHFKLVIGKSNRKLNDDYDDDFSSLMDYLEKVDLYTTKALPLGEIEALLKQKIRSTHVGTTKEINELLKEIMDEITTKPKGKLVITPISDRRSAVQPSAISDFENLDDLT